MEQICTFLLTICAASSAACGFPASHGPPQGNHPVDLGLDTTLRLRAIDTLKKQLIVISHIVA